MMEKSMNYLWAKQAAILDNIANAETPNYKTKVVKFEDSLKQKLWQWHLERFTLLDLHLELKNLLLHAMHPSSG